MTTLPVRQRERNAARSEESFLLKTLLVGSVLVLTALVVVALESATADRAASLSETEATLRLAAAR